MHPLGETGAERRRAERIRSQIRTTVRSIESGIGPGVGPGKARVIDICDHGACLLLRRGYTVGQRLEMDLECEVPLRVHLGYDADSLVIDGPMHTHLVSLEATVVRAERLPNRLWQIGVEFHEATPFDERQFMQTYVDHLREVESWHS